MIRIDEEEAMPVKFREVSPVFSCNQKLKRGEIMKKASKKCSHGGEGKPGH